MKKGRVTAKGLIKTKPCYALFLFLLAFLAIFPTTVFAKASKKEKASKSAPEWAVDIDKVFPPDKFIARLGKGESEADAQSNALGQLALFFDANIERTALALYKAKESDGATQAASSIDVATVVKSSVSLQGVLYTAEYFDKKSKLHLVVGYLEKSKAFSRYDEEIATFMSAIEKQVLLAKQKAGLWKTVEHSKVALEQRAKVLPLIYTASTLAPKTSYYSDDLDMLFSLDSLFVSLKKSFPISFVVEINGDAKDTQILLPLASLVKDAFGKAGYSFSGGDSAFQVRITLLSDERAQKSEDLVLYTIRNATLTIEKCDSKTSETFESHSLSWSGKASSYRRDKAYSKVTATLEEDLKKLLSNEEL